MYTSHQISPQYFCFEKSTPWMYTIFKKNIQYLSENEASRYCSIRITLNAKVFLGPDSLPLCFWFAGAVHLRTNTHLAEVNLNAHMRPDSQDSLTLILVEHGSQHSSVKIGQRLSVFWTYKHRYAWAPHPAEDPALKPDAQAEFPGSFSTAKWFPEPFQHPNPLLCAQLSVI